MVRGRLNRRQMIAGMVGLAVAGACGADDGDAVSGVTGAVDATPSYLTPFFATGMRESPVLRTGMEQRTPWGVADADGVPMRDLPAEVTMRLLLGNSPVGDPIPVSLHGEGVPFPYYPLRFTVNEPGTYTAALTIDGRDLEREFAVTTPDAVPLVQRGEKAVPVETPTTTDARGVDPICTREPACPFHDVSLAAALGNGQPTVFLVSTPAWCQTNVCGPVLETLIDVAEGRDTLQVIHAEVYADVGVTGDPMRSQLSEAVTSYGLSFEPSLVVVDGGGVVAERLDFTWDRRELQSALAQLG